MNKSSLPDRVDAWLASAPAGPLLLALSGGLDSSVLLQLLAGNARARQRGLRAVHVDHGLSVASASWAGHCRELAAQLDVAIDCITVDVAAASGRGIEAAARAARYAAIATVLGAGELLVTAQHRDDQSETVLLKLLRGAGPEGLGGMRPLRPFGAGYLWRPLLDVPRQQLLAHANAHRLHWIEDPSNADLRLSRNFLRQRVLPQLRSHWPDADLALAHGAAWNRAAADFITGHARQAQARLQGLDPATLRWQDWLDLPEALRDPVLRLWLRELGLAEPNHAQVRELQQQLRVAAAHRMPCLRWPGVELRRYRDLLYAMRPLPADPTDWQEDWATASLLLPAGCGQLRRLRTIAPAAGRSSEWPVWQVRFRRGGEALKPPGMAHTRELRLLFQESGIPPWQRGRIPLLYANGSLLAVADLWRSDAGDALLQAHALQLEWQP